MSSKLNEIFRIKEASAFAAAPSAAPAQAGAGTMLKLSPDELELLVNSVEANHELTPQEKSGLMKKLQAG